MSEETEIILKSGALFVMLIPLLSFLEPTDKPLKEHLKDVLKIMAGTSAIFLVIAFLSHMELLRPISDFMRSKSFLIPMITLTTAVPIFIELIRTLNEMNRHNYKKEIAIFLFVTTVVVSINQLVYFFLTHDIMHGII